MIKRFRTRDLRAWILLVVSLLLVVLRPTPDQLQVRQDARRGYQALQAGGAAQALSSFEAALAAEPALGFLHLTAARLALQVNDISRAGYHLAQAELIGISHPDQTCFRMILALLNIEAIEPQLVESMDGHRCEALTLVTEHARRLIAEGQWESASEILSQLLIIQAENPTPVREISLLMAITNPLNAVHALQQASELTGETDPLLMALIRAIENSRPSANLAFTLAQVGQTFARSGLWQEASWAFRQAIELEPEYVEAIAYYGLSLDQIGGDGLEYLSRAEAAFPGAALPHVFLGMHWSTRGELTRAQLELEIAVGLDRDDPSAWAELGSVYAQQGKVAEAKEAYIQAVTLAPSEWEFWYHLAQFSTNLEIEVADLGIPASRNLVSLGSSDPRSYDLLGYAHFLNGNLLLAERHLLHAISLDPTLASAQYHLGQLRRWQGDTVRSQAAFQLALQLDPQGPIGNLARRALGLPLTD